jgi:hypothetical protein
MEKEKNRVVLKRTPKTNIVVHTSTVDDTTLTVDNSTLTSNLLQKKRQSKPNESKWVLFKDDDEYPKWITDGHGNRYRMSDIFDKCLMDLLQRDTYHFQLDNLIRDKVEKIIQDSLTISIPISFNISK